MTYFITNQTRIDLHEDITLCNLDFLLDYFKDETEVQVDTETEGFFNHSNKIICLQLGDFENQFVIDFPTLSKLEVSIISDKILANSNIVKIFHNAKFDIQFLWFHGMNICNVYDTMLAECILNAGKETEDGFYGLKSTCLRYCNYELDKEIRGIIHREGLSTRVIFYAAEDVKYLSKIKEVQHSKLIELELAKKDCQDIHTILGLENNAVLAFAEMEYNGMRLDTKKWEQVRLLVIKEREEILTKLNEEVINNPKLKQYWFVYQDLFTSAENRVNINWNSPAQKLELLNKIGKFESTKQQELEKHKRDNKIVDLLIKYNKMNKLLTAFADKLAKHINPVTKRIHTNFWQILDTGRVSCSEPNLQQIPSRTEIGGKMRECFIVEEGNKMVGGDFSGCELRVIAEYSQDPIWLEAFKNDEDLHSKLCALTFGIDIADVKKPSHFKPDLKYRDIQKTINFGLAYGMSKFKLADTIEIEVEQAGQIIDKFFKAVPKVKQFLDMLGRTAVQKGRIKSPPPYRRIRWFDDYKSQDKKILGSIERQGKNMPIQACNADLTKLALIQLYREIHNNNLPVRLIHTVHDEIQCEVREDFAEQWVITMNNLMEESGKVVVQSIPMKVDCKISGCWSK